MLKQYKNKQFLQYKIIIITEVNTLQKCLWADKREYSSCFARYNVFYNQQS